MTSNYTFRPLIQEPLSVTPLNSMPYVDPITSLNNFEPHQHQEVTESPKTPDQTMVFLTSRPTEEERNNIFSVTKNTVVLCGSAAVGTVGPVLGKMDIAENADSYIFRVSLPGVDRENFTCDVAPEGNILIKGVTTTGEKVVYKNSMRFEMQTQNLCPPGHFSISFRLPSPVDPGHLTAHFGIDGVFEGLVKKRIDGVFEGLVKKRIATAN